jgi:hypothetical protein
MALWYVDGALATGTQAGTSWANAWRSIAGIAWASLGPNDTLYISGGSTSQTYNELMTVGAHTATAGNPLTITAGIDAGHNGTVIFDGTTAMTFGAGGANIDSGGRTNFILQNMTVQNTFESCIRVSGVSTGTVTVQNMTCHTGSGVLTLTTNGTTAAANATLHFASVPAGIAANASVADQTTPAVIPTETYVVSKTSTTVVMNKNAVGAGVGSGDIIQFAFNARGVRVDANSGGVVTVQGCTIDTPANALGQTDGIYTSANTGSTGSVIVQNNTITINNINPSGHNDAIQSFQDTNVTFRGNTLSLPNGGINNVHDVNLENVVTGGTVEFSNNTVYMGPVALSAGAVPDPSYGFLLQQTSAGFAGTQALYNNTIQGGSPCVSFYTPQTGQVFILKNNIMYCNPLDMAPYGLNSGALATPANVANNLIYTLNNNLRLSASSSTSGGVRSTTSKSSGLSYFEIQLGYVFAGGNTTFGLANATKSLTTFLGGDLNGIGYWWSNGGVYINGTAGTTIFTSAFGDIIGIAYDQPHAKIWLKNWSTGTGWNNAAIGSQDPANNIGGISLSTLNAGPYFICHTVNSDATYSVLNTGATSFAGTMPVGYSAWGSATTWNPADIAAGATLTAPVAVISSNTSETFAAWQTLGYDVGGVNADPLFVTNGSDYHLQSSSPAKDAGTTIATVTTDKDGNARPQGSAYDIGAYELLARRGYQRHRW